jgi:acylpyruvate hydrolase
MQKSVTSELVFPPNELVSYLSDIFTLVPGDVIATGTPSGVGHARTPARYLQDGSVMVSRIDRVGALHNRCRVEAR